MAYPWGRLAPTCRERFSSKFDSGFFAAVGVATALRRNARRRAAGCRRSNEAEPPQVLFESLEQRYLQIIGSGQAKQLTIEHSARVALPSASTSAPLAPSIASVKISAVPVEGRLS